MREHDHPARRNKHEISSLKIEDVHDLGTTYQQQQGGTYYGPITNISCLHMRPPWSFFFAKPNAPSRMHVYGCFIAAPNKCSEKVFYHVVSL